MASVINYKPFQGGTSVMVHICSVYIIQNCLLHVFVTNCPLHFDFRPSKHCDHLTSIAAFHGGTSDLVFCVPLFWCQFRYCFHLLCV